MSSVVLALTVLLAAPAAPADPPPADTCCLTYGQVQDIIAIWNYIPASAVSQCLIGSAKDPTAYPNAGRNECLFETVPKDGAAAPNVKDFRFIPDQTVGLSKNKDGSWLICIQWPAIEEAVKKRPSILLLHGGEQYGV